MTTEVEQIAAGLSCPICGEGDDFDQGGLVRHIDRYCDEAERLRGEWAEQDRAARERLLRQRVEPIANLAVALSRHLQETPNDR